MTHAAIHVEEMGKKFHIGGKEGYKTLRETLSNAPLKQFRSLKIFENRNGNSRKNKEAFWALKNISFEVKCGEVIGIIGRNGAGKSTLLKILSRITEPTVGFAEIRGRVGSLLEVGTGFHPELTGRENVYLNGAIIGMKRAEISRKFDEIVAFSEVGKFLDTAVKHYSSGMYLRLAFAVAAHLEPEVLLVDEVLAVGDVAFQRKCLGKMNDVAREGRTVLFVSHNMGAIIQLCPMSILLQEGELVAKGASKQVVESYLAAQFSRDNEQHEDASVANCDGRFQIVSVYLETENNEQTSSPITGLPVNVVIEFVCREELAHVQFKLTIHNQMGVPVTHCNVDAYGQRFSISMGEGRMICRLPKLALPLGRYRIAVKALDDSGQLALQPTACVFDVDTSNFYPTSYVPSMKYSTVLVEHSWELRQT